MWFVRSVCTYVFIFLGFPVPVCCKKFHFCSTFAVSISIMVSSCVVVVVVLTFHKRLIFL